MDFFSAQDQARRNTGRLVFFFLLAVLTLIVLTNLLVMITFGAFKSGLPTTASRLSFNWQLFSAVSCGVLLVIGGGTLYKISKLSGGGDAVAAMFGAEPIFGDDPDINVQKVIHVVEEMAIASGTPVPQTYLLKEEGINAFAAGFSTSDAIIAVTRGAVSRLNREQLQGVIAHEFSHILNGDMRLNIRLVGVLHGILLLGLIGNQILRGSGRSSSSRRGGGGGLLLGLGLVVIGYTGTFFGNLIKAAVSRQREFLADAAAVQFTRNPWGIGGALLQIGAAQAGSLLRNPKSDELSHAFFSQGVTVTFESLFATHPPLSERIRRILPDWDGQFPSAAEPESVRAATLRHADAAAAGLTAETVMEHIGRPNMAHLLQARNLLQELPEIFIKAARDPFAARALLLFLVLDLDADIRARQLQQVKETADRGVFAEINRLVRSGEAPKQQQRLPLVELALPTLRRLSTEQSRTFLGNLNALIRADGKISLFEWCLLQIVTQHLEQVFSKPAGTEKTIRDPGTVAEECSIVLSTLVSATRHNGLQAKDVFAAAITELGRPDIKPVPSGQLGLPQLNRALKILKGLRPHSKARFIKACITCVEADGRIDPVEMELLRGIAASLAVPMPPLTPGNPEHAA